MTLESSVSVECLKAKDGRCAFPKISFSQRHSVVLKLFNLYLRVVQISK